MARIASIDRAEMTAEQARVYDAAKETSGIVGGPYVAYIRLPKLFEAAQNMRGCLSGGPLRARVCNLCGYSNYFIGPINRRLGYQQKRVKEKNEKANLF